MIGDGTVRRLKCKWCNKDYKHSGVWFMRHFQNNHLDDRIACKVIFVKPI